MPDSARKERVNKEAQMELLSHIEVYKRFLSVCPKALNFPELVLKMTF